MLREFDIIEALKIVLVKGAELVPRVINPQGLDAINRDLDLLSFSLEDSTTKTGVRQKFKRAAFRKTVPKSLPAILQLQQETGKLIRSAHRSFPMLKMWEPYDAIIQKYSAQDFLTAHLDLKRHPYVIVIYNIEGSCMFEILSERKGYVVKDFRPGPGDLLLLRAPGLSGHPNIDDRPFHQVGGNLSKSPHRTSITFRHNLEPHKAIRGLNFGYDN